MSFAHINIVGNLGRNPELRYTPQGKAVCDYSVAINTRRRGKQGEADWVDETLWFKVTTWDKQAENDSKFLEKGREVSVTGRLGIEHWTDRQGVPRQTMVISPMHIEYIGGAKSNDDDDFWHDSAKSQQPKQDFAGDFSGTQTAAEQQASDEDW